MYVLLCLQLISVIFCDTNIEEALRVVDEFVHVCCICVAELGLQYNRCVLPPEQRSHTLYAENQFLLLKVKNNCKNCRGMKA